MDNKKNTGNFGAGFISDVILKIRLTIALLQDSRIHIIYKLIPGLCLVYLIAPLDFLFGPIDDAVVIYFGLDFFINICPQEIVREHVDKINGKTASRSPEQIVDAEFKDIK
jgi:uncharacterized membrane protein YkvA (DUF1232 family)